MTTTLVCCRVCGSKDLRLVLDLGSQVFAGHFPRPENQQSVPRGPLEVVVCGDCSLAQLRHEFPAEQLFGSHYGYRSGLNDAMKRHLVNLTMLVAGSGEPLAVLDIGANDGTLLNCLEPESLRIGMDPLANKFAQYWSPEVIRVPEFFTAQGFFRASRGQKADVVFSVAMFYDLPDPVGFAREVESVLAPGGRWLLEVAYLPSMLEATAFDTVCHEHAEYYSLTALKNIMDRAGLTIQHCELTATNGGSVVLIVGKDGTESPTVKVLLAGERKRNWAAEFFLLARRVADVRDWCRDTLAGYRRRGELVLGLGASTKGNVLLQRFGIGPDLLPAIGEVNADKFGRETPGTGISIVPMAEVYARKPAALFVLPWHFRQGIVAQEQEFLNGGGQLIFPLPVPIIQGAT